MGIPVFFWFPVLVSLGMGFMAMSIPPVAGQFMELFGVGFGGLSFFLSAFYWTHSLVQVPAGLLIDRIGAVKSLALFVAISLGCGLLPFLSPASLALAIVSRLLLGLSTGSLFLVTVKITKALCPPNHIARVQAAQGAAFSLGTMLPYLTLPLAGPYGWAISYIMCTGFCVLVAAGMFRLPLKNLDSGSASATPAEVWRSMKVISSAKHVWFIGVCHGLAFGSLNVIGNWLPSILVDTEPATTIESWALITSILLLVGTTGRLFGGEVARKMPRSLILNRVMLVIAFSYGIIALSPVPLPIIGVAFFMAALCGITYASVFTLAIHTAQPAYVATAVGFMNMVANLINVLLILMLGSVRDITGSFAPGLCLSAFLTLAFWFGSRKLASGLARVDA